MNKESKYGITLEKYTELIVKTSNIGDDEAACVKILENENIDVNDWKKAKKEWDDKINDPGDDGKTYAEFLPLYQAALERKYFGGAPCSLEEFTKIHCEMSFRKDPFDSQKPVKYETVLKENKISVNKWEICNSFWTVRVGLPNYRKKFAELVRKYTQYYSNTRFGKVS
jgi:hypothetical protein